MRDLAALDGELLGIQRRLECRQQAVGDGVCLADEEVEVVRLAIDRTTHNEGTATPERETLGFGEIGEDGGDALLQRAQHARSTPR